MVLTKAIITVKDGIIMWKRLSLIQLDIMLRKASEARVDRRLRRYYLIVLLLPNIFTLGRQARANMLGSSSTIR